VPNKGVGGKTIVFKLELILVALAVWADSNMFNVASETLTG
jgi:hypothetical protein